ncbi:MAG TPA: hypothetical protein VFB79_04125 [Candidatus Angelobacter sp.]|nr:hypothetical protein [Candidatus Angelobacter sp.]
MGWSWRGALLLSAILATAPVLAQTTANPANPRNGRQPQAQDENDQDGDRGFNAHESFRGVYDSAGLLLKVDSSGGYDFNQHFSVFAGVPFYVTRDSAAAGGPSNPVFTGIGDVYFGPDFYFPTDLVDYSSSVTFGAPTGSVNKGFSTGHFTVDWDNRLRRSFGMFAPYVSVDVGNTVPDTEDLTRTFTSYGNVVDLEEGFDVNLTRRFYTGADAYQIIPFGKQEIVSRLGNGADTNGTSPVPTVVGEDLIREHGYDAWIGFEPTRIVRLEVGYSRSITFQENRVSFNVGINVGRLLHLQRH